MPRVKERDITKMQTNPKPSRKFLEHEKRIKKRNYDKFILRYKGYNTQKQNTSADIFLYHCCGLTFLAFS